MGRLTDDERRLLAELQERDAAPDDDAEDFDLEIYDTGSGKGARLPYKKGAKWLYDAFGIGDAPAPATGTPDAGGEGAAGGARAGGDSASGGEGAAGGRRPGYFGRR